MDKKILIIAAVVVILIAGVFLWKGGSPGQKGGIMQPVIGNKMTDAIQIEIMTELAKNAINNPDQSQDETLKETNAILSKYGITPVEYGEYIQALYADKTRSAEMDAKQQQIMLDLLKNGGK